MTSLGDIKVTACSTPSLAQPSVRPFTLPKTASEQPRSHTTSETPSEDRLGRPGEVAGVVGLGEAPAQPLLLGQLVDGVGEVGKVGPASGC